MAHCELVIARDHRTVAFRLAGPALHRVEPWRQLITVPLPLTGPALAPWLGDDVRDPAPAQPDADRVNNVGIVWVLPARALQLHPTHSDPLRDHHGSRDSAISTT